MKQITPLFMLFALLLMAACDHDVVSEQIAEVKGEKWKANEAVKCECEIEDADAYYTMELEVRNTVDYPYRNLYLFVEIETPDTMKYCDTVQLFLADNEIYLIFNEVFFLGSVNVTEILRDRSVEYDPSDGGINKTGDPLSVEYALAAYFYLCMKSDNTGLISHDDLIGIAEDLALAHFAVLVKRQIV